MTRAHTFKDEPASAPQSARRKVLVTGAAGHIGSYFARHAHEKYELRLLVRPEDKPELVERIHALGEIVVGDIRDVQRMKEIAHGIDTILHLAASANASQTWDVALNTNIIGTYNVFVAAKHAAARRVVFASSVHAVSGYPRGVQIRSEDPVNPGDLYGVSKCFGEALARYVAEQEGVSAIVLRIGAWCPPEWNLAKAGDWPISHMDVFISADDLQQLIERSIDDQRLRFAIFNGASENTVQRLDIDDARELLGYEPKHDLAREVEGMKDLHIAAKLMQHNLQDGRQTSGLRAELGE
jgi:nucleoside-diphosphate-sugar epimerase